jgi:hypothetical protein
LKGAAISKKRKNHVATFKAKVVAGGMAKGLRQKAEDLQPVPLHEFREI